MNREIEIIYNGIIESIKGLGLSSERTDELISIISIKVELFISRHPNFEQFDEETKNETLQKFKSVLLETIQSYVEMNANTYDSKNKAM